MEAGVFEEIGCLSQSLFLQKFLVGLVKDVTSDVSQKAYFQLMNGNIDAYLFTYDIVEDKLYLSSRFVEDFDLPSGEMERFTQNYTRYMYEEDAAFLNELFSNYLETKTMTLGETIRFLAPGRGDLYLRLDGVSDYSPDGRSDSRYISGVLSDVTMLRAEKLRMDAFKSGTDCIEFTADINRETLVFSDNITDIFPNNPKVITGDFVEEFAQRVATKDRKRFRNAMHRAVNEPGSKFSVEFRVRKKGGQTVWLACRGMSYFDSVLNSNILSGSIINLSQYNEIKEYIEKKEASNELTGLPTRDKLMNDMSNMIRNPQLLSCALILFDIADFHVFNDNYGREAGNSVLYSVASFITENMPDNSELYHVGIDTFALLWKEATRKSVQTFLEEIIARNNSPMVTPEGEFFVNLFVAASMYPEGDTTEDIFNNAEIALHKMKSDKSIKYLIYSPADKMELNNRIDFVSQISTCIINNMENFQLYYQPLIDARTNELKGAEALLRWQSRVGCSRFGSSRQNG